LKHFEESAFKDYPYTPTFFKRYVDDSFAVFPHGRDKLDEFLKYLNSIHPSIQFTMEVEENNSLPFLDVLITKRSDGSLSHSTYRKKTHTDRYLHASSHHFPSQLNSVAASLINRSLRLTDDEHKEDEIKNLKKY
jgi:hypothetical protein